MDFETTPTTPAASEADKPSESDDTSSGSFGLRRLPASLACFLATTPVAGLSAYDVFTRDIVAPSTISTEEESSLVSLGIGPDIRPNIADEPRLEISQANAANRRG